MFNQKESSSNCRLSPEVPIGERRALEAIVDMYSRKDRSTPQKVVMTVLQITLLAIAFWVLFRGGGYRRVILFASAVVIFVRMTFTMTVFLKRRIPWAETFSVPFAFALYYVGFAALGHATTSTLGPLDYAAIGLFVLGSFLNTGSEAARHRFKSLPENSGRLYTGGLFRAAIHVNYFGDILWVTACAVLTGNWWSASIPVFLICFFAFYNVPKLDVHLREKYGEEFVEWELKSKKLIPFVW